jgi:phenylacetate-CoA ligase
VAADADSDLDGEIRVSSSRTRREAVSSLDPNIAERLRAHVEYAYKEVPFYRDLYDSHGISLDALRSPLDLPRLPLVTKEMTIKDQEARPPFGGFRVDPGDLSRVSLIASRYFMFLTKEDWGELTELYKEAYQTLGVLPTDIVDVSSAFTWVQGGTQCDTALRELGAAVIPGGPGQSRQRVRVMQDLGVTVFHAFTPYAEELTTRFDEYGVDADRDLRIRLVIIGGELSSRSAKERLQTAWGGAVVREFYGVSEAGMIATECFDVGAGMHVNDRCVVEVIDPDTEEHVPMGEPGELVITELFRKGQPFIRYRTGDLTEGMVDEPCPCGRSSCRLGRITSRNSAIVRVKGLFIEPRMVDQAVRRVLPDTVWAAAVRRTSLLDEMTCQVETRLDAENIDQVMQAIQREIKETAGILCRVEAAPAAIVDGAGQILDLRSDS